MEIRTSVDFDEEGIRALFSACFGKELSREEWVWKYRHSPWGSAAAVALDSGEIMAHYGGLGIKFHHKGRTFRVFEPCDVMTHPKYRARIFSKRGAMVRAGEHFFGTNPMDFAFGFPSERHAVLGTKQLGYTEHGYVAVLSKKMSPFKPFLPLLVKLKSEWSGVAGSEIDSLWREVRDVHNLTIDKDSKYIFWRYRDHPNKSYDPLLVKSRSSGVLQAFAVLSCQGSDLLVLDFFHKSSFPVRKFLRIIEGMASRRRLSSVKLWVHPDEELFRVFKHSGYSVENGVPYIFRIINPEIKPEYLFGNYCYRMGDYDAA